jgi:hypothetical protein
VRELQVLNNGFTRPQKTLDNRYTNMIRSVMLARQITLSNPPNQTNSSPHILLRTLCHSEKSQVRWNQANPRSLDKTPGWGVPKHFRATRRFRRHMRHLAPLSPVPSIDCAYFLSPRGCTRRSHYPLLTAHDPRFCGPFVFILLQIPLSATPLLAHLYETPGGGGAND